ncbi:chemotaxis protein CheW [Pseudokineococcus marinus]|uniref:Chemotaxis protein CheW n=1 Tax=Pseudokineococcus marinus TaxID=351215 RepID=A0A849BU16_9ACTN|nr:chemotaxis protein CheW [Pseudokineococcus marinus]NNH24447.1 chemotaxis protein CheW [Pseudokineococcus marinus]
MTVSYVTFHLGDGLYGIEVLRVQEVLTEQALTRVPLAPPEVAGLVNLRGQVVTAVDLRRRLGLPPREEGLPTTDLVVRVGDEVVALLVDSIGDVVEVSEDDLEPPPDTLSGPMADLITGACQLPDRLLMPLDATRTVALGSRA